MAELDNILDSALEDFEEQQLLEKAAATAQKDSAAAKSKAQKTLAQEKEKRARAEEMARLMKGVEDPEFGPTVQKTLQDLSNTEEGNQTVEDLFSGLKDKFVDDKRTSFLPDGQPMQDDAEGIQNADFEVAKTLKMLGEAQKGMAGFEAGKMEEAGEQMIEDMMGQFESLGEKEDYQEVVDGVMRQLLSKDLMWEPTKQICEKFPEWLALHKKNLGDAEYENYGKQYQAFQKILAVYETEPDNFPRLMELMFDMQAFGQPPADIITDLAPGLRFDENGMPIMPNMGPGMMPGGEGNMPNMDNLPQMMATGQCSIM
jgi:peroxin-19